MKKLLIAISTALAVGVGLAATKGSCESAAASISVGRSTTVKLVAEYDPEDRSYDDSGDGVYYLTTTLSRGYAYTLTYSGATADEVSVYAYPRETTEAEDEKDIYSPFASFSEFGDGSFNGVYVQYLQSEDWDSEDPSSWKYYIVVSGELGASVTVSLASGIVQYADPGSSDNPTTLSFADTLKTGSYDFLDGEYYFSASLKAGRFYRVRTTGGTTTYPVYLSLDAGDSNYAVFEDQEYSSDTNNVAYIVAPDEDAKFTFLASGTNTTFGLAWQSIPTRAITAHPSTPLDASNNFTATIVPGRRINSYKYADDIIDETLCSIVLAKGERWVFSTEGAVTPCDMVLYDAKGKILATNSGTGNGSFDTLIGYEVTAAGTYYVGVCESELGVMDTPLGEEVTLVAEKVGSVNGDPDEWDAADDTAAGATALSPLPAVNSIDPTVEGSAHGPHRLGVTDWTDCFQIGARKGLTYALTAVQTGEETTDLTLQAEVFTLSGTTERLVKNVTGGIDPTADDYLEFEATANATYYIRVSVAEGKGLTYPDYTIYALAYSEDSDKLGILTVNTPGASSATWSIGSESTKYPGGASILVSGNQTIKFSSITGFKSAVATTNVTVEAGAEPTVVDVKYIDTFDPKDDAAVGRSGSVSYSPTSLTFKNTDTEYAKRTLWDDDPADTFVFAGNDGYLYDIELRNVEGDEVYFSITNAQDGVVVEDVTSVTQLALPKLTGSAKYVLTVYNGEEATTYGGYTLAGKFANVGAIKFSKTAVSAKENAANVAITVNRTAKDGYVRVLYGTVAGTAKPGVDYVAQSGVLEWANGDNKAKTISVKLIPDLVSVYEGNKTFSVKLRPVDEEDRSSSEYPAVIAGGDECVVTLTETAKATDTVESAYAKIAPKLATVKTETVALETGTFYGVLSEDGSSLTNGFPKFASIQLTASTANPSKLSAKVALGGANYTFAGTGWEEGVEENTLTQQLLLSQKVNRLDEETNKTVSETVTNILTVTVASGATATDGDWLRAGGSVELEMIVPDADKKGYQETRYIGEIYRNNAKIQGYFNVVTNFTGYYTIALAPDCVDATVAPAGNGYVTLTIDNKGTAKVAGMLSDGTTKPSLSVAACAIKEDNESAIGYSMFVPVYFAKKPAVFAGEIRLFVNENDEVVADASRPLAWYNDEAKVTYYNEEGWQLNLAPCGGWYDTIINLQTYYLTRGFYTQTEDASNLPEELLAAGYSFVTDVQPDGTDVDLAGDAFSTAKKALVKSGSVNDLLSSTNPCNVQVKLTRKTGLVTGSFSLWSEDASGKQKEITGLKVNGVLVLSRDVASPIGDETVVAGFWNKSVKRSATVTNETTGRTSNVSWNWNISLPFNVIGEDQGDIDWWAEDWGDND